MPCYPQHFPLIFWPMWQVCWITSFLEHTSLFSGISKPQDYAGYYCWGEKSSPNTWLFSPALKMLDIWFPVLERRSAMIRWVCPRHKKTNYNLYCLHGLHWGVFQGQSSPRFRDVLKEETPVCQRQHLCKSLCCSEWAPMMLMLMELCSLQFLCCSDNTSPTLNAPFVIKT